MLRSKKDLIYEFCNAAVLTLIIFMMIFPLWYVFVCSLSESSAVLTGKVMFWPHDFNLDAYKLVFEIDYFFAAYGNTFYYTIVGTIVNLGVTLLAAYPLSRKRLAGRKWISLFIMFSMWFSAGIIPTYLNFKELNLLNNRAAIIIGFACTAFYIILMRSQFERIPDEMEESAKMDGANDWTVFWHIYVPMSVPTIMTLGLYYAVGRWNGYFWAMLLFTETSKIPLQVLLTKLIKGLAAADSQNAVDFYNYSKETVVYATIVIATIPMIVLYPFIQKFFVKGITLGAVKG